MGYTLNPEIIRNQRSGFFQHKIYNLDSQSYENIDIAFQNCGDDWTGFVEFLEQETKDNNININTKWPEVQGKWKSKAV